MSLTSITYKTMKHIATPQPNNHVHHIESQSISVKLSLALLTIDDFARALDHHNQTDVLWILDTYV